MQLGEWPVWLYFSLIISFRDQSFFYNLFSYWYALISGNVEIYLLKEYLIKKFPGILALHEFHTWTFTPETLVLTGHIMYQDKMVYMDIHKQVEHFLKSQGFSIITIQPEFPSSSYPTDEEISTCTLKCKVSYKLQSLKKKLNFCFPFPACRVWRENLLQVRGIDNPTLPQLTLYFCFRTQLHWTISDQDQTI